MEKMKTSKWKNKSPSEKQQSYRIERNVWAHRSENKLSPHYEQGHSMMRGRGEGGRRGGETRGGGGGK